MSEYVTIFQKGVSEPGVIPEEDIAMVFPYELDGFQKEGIYRIYKSENVFITAHTGSGKTVLALYAIAEMFRLGKRVVYTSPTKSLSNQKYAEFVEKFGKEKIGILTGDIKMNPDAPCLIMTTEILRNVLYRDTLLKEGKEEGASTLITSLRVDEIGAVVFDEVHYVNDPERGKVWEEVFVMLPREVVLVLLSATIDRPQDFAGWLGDLKKKPIHLIPTSHRVVPLRHYFWEPERDEMIQLLMEDGEFKNYDKVKGRYKRHDIGRLMTPLVKKLKGENMLPTLFFNFSRKKCEKLCRSVQGISLLDHLEEAEVRKIFDHYMHPYREIYEMIPQYQEIYELMRRGIAYHHSGLIPILKEIVEIMFGKGLVKVLYATETFAVGVNMPTKTVVFGELEKFDDKGRRYLRTDEYLQMSGRAGRRGLDKVGTVILIPTMDWPDQNQLRSMMTGKSPCIISKFSPTYQFLLKTLQTEVGSTVFLENTYRSVTDKRANEGLYKEIEELSSKLSQMKVSESFLNEYEKYERNEKRLADRFFVIKGKDRKKVEDEQKSFKMKHPDFEKSVKEIVEYQQMRSDLNQLRRSSEEFETMLKQTSDKMMIFLREFGYISESETITEKGVTATVIGEADEIMMSEMIHQGMLEKMSMEEIVTSLAIFVDEIDKSSEEKYIQDLEIPSSIKSVYQRMTIFAEECAKAECDIGIRIHDDEYYEKTLNLDMLEPIWIWVNGGGIRELFQSTELYAGNFVRGTLRLNQLCETFVKIMLQTGRLEIVKKMEGYQERLIKDFAQVISLYVK
jgi:superfamily II RNA helicase